MATTAIDGRVPNATSPQVLIVGAGPAGMFAACELLRRGVSVRIVDAAPEPAPHSKALLLWPRTLDVLAELGLACEVRQRGIRIDSFKYYSEREQLANVKFSSDLASWALPQCSTEEILRTKLATLGCRTERGIRLLALDRIDFSENSTNSSGVTAVLEHQDGYIERFHTPWLIGADGAGSTVRAQLGLGFTGSTYANRFLLADAYIDGQLADNEAHYYQSRDGVLVIVALPSGLFRFFASLQQGSIPDANLPLMQRLVEERGPSKIRLVDPEWTSMFRVHRRRVERFQFGRAFLVGDAAHIHSPAGGQGLNAGLQDAHNLAWKLAAVIQGGARQKLLESYTSERLPAVQRVMRDTDLQTRAWMFRNPAAVAARNTVFKIANHSGLIKHYLPTMAGRSIRYPAKESIALLTSHRRCEQRGKLIVGVAPPPGLIAPPTDHARSPWTLLISSSVMDIPSGLHQVVSIATSPELAVVAGCPRTAFILIRPDGFIAARGHQSDLPKVGSWLINLLT